MSRFDYVKYDNISNEYQATFKRQATELERYIQKLLKVGRAKATALTKLEECYMWIAKQIRDHQIARNGPAELQEERKNDSEENSPNIGSQF